MGSNPIARSNPHPERVFAVSPLPEPPEKADAHLSSAIEGFLLSGRVAGCSGRTLQTYAYNLGRSADGTCVGRLEEARIQRRVDFALLYDNRSIFPAPMGLECLKDKGTSCAGSWVRKEAMHIEACLVHPNAKMRQIRGKGGWVVRPGNSEDIVLGTLGAKVRFPVSSKWT